MAGVNKVILLGRVGQEPEVKYLESGSVVANFSLATSESYKNKEGQRVENTEWHDLEIWEGLAKVVEQYVKQGDMLYIEGKIKSSVWQDEQGNNRKKSRIRVTTMTMMPKTMNGGGGNQQDNGGNSNGGNMKQNTSSPQVNEPDPLSASSDDGSDIDDLPF